LLFFLITLVLAALTRSLRSGLLAILGALTTLAFAVLALFLGIMPDWPCYLKVLAPWC
jgi:hypothetical protein